MPAVPDIPTIDEQGLKGFETGSWFGMAVPTGTPRDIVNKLHAEAVRLIALPEIRDRLRGRRSAPGLPGSALGGERLPDIGL